VATDKTLERRKFIHFFEFDNTENMIKIPQDLITIPNPGTGEGQGKSGLGQGPESVPKPEKKEEMKEDFEVQSGGNFDGGEPEVSITRDKEWCAILQTFFPYTSFEKGRKKEEELFTSFRNQRGYYK
jgi:hypothetical protein